MPPASVHLAGALKAAWVPRGDRLGRRGLSRLGGFGRRRGGGGGAGSQDHRCDDQHCHQVEQNFLFMFDSLLHKNWAC